MLRAVPCYCWEQASCLEEATAQSQREGGASAVSLLVFSVQSLFSFPLPLSVSKLTKPSSLLLVFLWLCLSLGPISCFQAFPLPSFLSHCLCLSVFQHCSLPLVSGAPGNRYQDLYHCGFLPLVLCDFYRFSRASQTALSLLFSRSHPELSFKVVPSSGRLSPRPLQAIFHNSHIQLTINKD